MCAGKEAEDAERRATAERRSEFIKEGDSFKLHSLEAGRPPRNESHGASTSCTSITMSSFAPQPQPATELGRYRVSRDCPRMPCTLTERPCGSCSRLLQAASPFALGSSDSSCSFQCLFADSTRVPDMPRNNVAWPVVDP